MRPIRVPSLLLFALAFGPLVVAAVLALRRPPRVTLKGGVPSRLTAGRPVSASLTVESEAESSGPLAVSWVGPSLQDPGVTVTPVDSFVKLFWEHGQPLYGLLPYSVTGSALALESTIGERSWAGSGPTVVWAHRLTKAERWIKRRRFNSVNGIRRFASTKIRDRNPS